MHFAADSTRPDITATEDIICERELRVGSVIGPRATQHGGQRTCSIRSQKCLREPDARSETLEADTALTIANDAMIRRQKPGGKLSRSSMQLARHAKEGCDAQ